MENEIFNKIIELSKSFPGEVKINYQEHDKKRIYKYIGKFFCPVDDDLLQFLLKFNRVSLGNYFFFGIGDINGSKDLYRFCLDNWEINSSITPYFLGFATTPSGEILGSLTNYKGAKKYPVGYMNRISSKKFLVVGSGFGEFLKNLVSLMEAHLLTGDKTKAGGKFPTKDYWIERDAQLMINTEKGIYKSSTQDNWKLEFKLE